MGELEGKAAVITGGASGIGRAIAQRLASEGMNLVLADIESGPLEATAAELSASTDVLTVITDVADADAVDALRDQALERFGSVHVVCNNAGVGGLGDMSWEGPRAAWEWVVGVNLWGVVNGVRSFVPHLVENNAGHVVNTGSLASLGAAPGMGPYTATKHAVLALSEALQLELALRESKVKVHVLAPGFLKTGIAQSQRNWPERLGPRPEERDDDEAKMFRGIIDELVGGGLPPEQLAEALVEALADGRFFVTTHQHAASSIVEGRGRTVGGADPLFSDFT
jgi:NAD(P)-dependent dehydrogenase (short-subunit alcohol dehydrogenase family)